MSLNMDVEPKRGIGSDIYHTPEMFVEVKAGMPALERDDRPPTGRSTRPAGRATGLEEAYIAVMMVMTSLPSGFTGPSSLAPRVYSKMPVFMPPCSL